MASRRRSKKGGRRRQRAGRLPAAAAENALARLGGGRAAGGGEGTAAKSNSSNAPSSFVIRRGRLTPAARQLVRDMRRVMLPHCSERLRERRSSKLKDYLAAASLLGVTHLQLFSQTDAGLYFKVVQLPAGPTLCFRVLRFSLVHDVQQYQQQRKKNARAPDARDFLHPPLLILSPQAANRKNLVTGGGEGGREGALAGDKRGSGDAAGGQEKDVEGLVAKVIKGAFPPIDIRTVALQDCRRVVLFRRECSSPSSPPPSSFSSSSSSSFNHNLGLQYQLRQFAVVRRMAQDGGQVTPGVRALVEAGSSRIAADRLLQQRFGISFHSETPPFLAAEGKRRRSVLIGDKDRWCSSNSNERLRSAAVVGKAASAGAEAAADDAADEGAKIAAGRKFEAAAAAAVEADEGGEERRVNQRRDRAQQGTSVWKQSDEEDETADGDQQASMKSGNAGQQKRGKWRDICEATLAREHAAAAETDDEECLSLDMAEVGAGGAAGPVKAASGGRKSKEGLLLLSVAAAAAAQQQRGKKKGCHAGGFDTDITSAGANFHNSSPAIESEEEEDDKHGMNVADAAAAAAADVDERRPETDAAADEKGEAKRPENEKIKMKVSLVELGPRMHLELVKVEADVCAGAVIFHSFVKKTKEELTVLCRREAALRIQREKERKAVQQALEQGISKRKRGSDTFADQTDDGADFSSSPHHLAAGLAGTREEQNTKKLKSAPASLAEDGDDDDEKPGTAVAVAEKRLLSQNKETERKCALNFDPRLSRRNDGSKTSGDSIKNQSSKMHRKELAAVGAPAAEAGSQGGEDGESKANSKRENRMNGRADSRGCGRKASAVLRRNDGAGLTVQFAPSVAIRDIGPKVAEHTGGEECVIGGSVARAALSFLQEIAGVALD